MDYMLLIVNRRGEAPREPVGFPEMGKFAAELGQQGKMRGGAPLHPEEAGSRVKVRGGKTHSVDGPFAESKDVIGGDFVFDARDAGEALEGATRCPPGRAPLVVLHPPIAGSGAALPLD